MKQGSPERAKIRTNTDIVALSWGFPYHKCIFHSIVSRTPPCKAIKVKSQLLQLQAMNSQDESTHLAMIHTSIFASCATSGAAALVPSSAPGRLLPSLPPPASPLPHPLAAPTAPAPRVQQPPDDGLRIPTRRLQELYLE